MKGRPVLCCVFLNGVNRHYYGNKLQGTNCSTDKLQAQIDEVLQKERDEAIALILGKMAEFEITTQELDKVGKKKRTRASK